MVGGELLHEAVGRNTGRGRGMCAPFAWGMDAADGIAEPLYWP